MPAKWVTEVEPEFDVNERDSWDALAEYEAALCPQCGDLRSLCEGPTPAYHPQLHVCYKTAATEVYTRRWHKKYEGVKPDKDGWKPTDGGFIWVTDDPDMEDNPFAPSISTPETDAD